MGKNSTVALRQTRILITFEHHDSSNANASSVHGSSILRGVRFFISLACLARLLIRPSPTHGGGWAVCSACCILLTPWAIDINPDPAWFRF